MNKSSATRSGKAGPTVSVAPASQAAASKPGAAPAGGHSIDAEARRAMIAQGAYFRAEHRGFAAGFELDDWLEAEREIAHMLDA